MQTAYIFHHDPGHGWLAVPRAELEQLGIASQITAYSYQSRDGKTAYLEEDCDLSTFLQARKLAGPGWQAALKVRELYHEDDRIRGLPCYTPQAAPSQSALF